MWIIYNLGGKYQASDSIIRAKAGTTLNNHFVKLVLWYDTDGIQVSGTSRPSQYSMLLIIAEPHVPLLVFTIPFRMSCTLAVAAKHLCILPSDFLLS